VFLVAHRHWVLQLTAFCVQSDEDVTLSQALRDAALAVRTEVETSMTGIKDQLLSDINANRQMSMEEMMMRMLPSGDPEPSPFSLWAGFILVG
jgi:hypothetical protein